MTTRRTKHLASSGTGWHNRCTVPNTRRRRRFIFSIDRCTIFFGLNVPDIRRVIDYRHLKDNQASYARSINLRPASQEARMRGHHSQLNIVLPKPELLEHLSTSIQNDRHHVFSIELACDRLYDNQSETRTKQRQITKVLRKKWSQGVRIYDASESTPQRRRSYNSEYQDEMYDDQTTYTGGPNFEYKIYTRLSKISRQPCVHCEWTIRSDMIRRRAAVRTIDDLLNLDIERTFRNLNRQYITYEEINHEKHGRFIQNMTAASPTPGIVHRGPRAGASKMPFDRASRLYLKINDIKTSSQLRAHYMNKKKELAERPDQDRELTVIENRIVNLSTTKLNTFFTTLPDQLFET